MYATTPQEIRCIISSLRCFLLDLDGTVYLGGRLLPGAADFLRALRETGRSAIFVTNNSSKSGAEYVEKLTGMGIAVEARQVITSGQAAARYLRECYSGKRVYLLAGESLKQEFRGEGIALDEREPEVVVTAFDLGLDYRRLCRVCDLVRGGLPWIGTHPDLNCPTETGFIPDIGATHAYIHASTGRWPDRVIGKPERPIVDGALERAGCRAEEAAMVGDRLYTDVAAGVNNGLTGILVLSGETKDEDIAGSPTQPHLVFGSVAEMIPYL